MQNKLLCYSINDLLVYILLVIGYSLHPQSSDTFVEATISDSHSELPSTSKFHRKFVIL